MTTKKEEVKTKETIYETLARIQKELKAPKGQFNAFSKFNYRSCEDIVEAIKPLLDGKLLILTDEIVMVGTRYYVKAIATLSNGEHIIQSQAFAREADIKKGMDEAQITGSASSYARKYALNGLFAIDDTKDADSKDNDPTSTWPDQNKQTPYQQAKNNGATVSADEFTEKHICPTHNIQMKQRIAKNGGHYYDHRRQNEQGEWEVCNGKGFKVQTLTVKNEVTK